MEQLFTEEEIEEAPSSSNIDRKDFEPLENPFDTENFVLKTESKESLNYLILGINRLFQSTQKNIEILSFGVGDITKEDIEKAKEENGEVIGFQVEYEAESDDVNVHTYSIIYHIIEDLRELKREM